MSPLAKWEYMKVIYRRYHRATRRKDKSVILSEFCRTYQCHRKHALRLLNGLEPAPTRPERRRRGSVYTQGRLLSIVEAVWEASGYLCGQRLKPTLALWLLWIRKRFKTTPDEERLLSAISSATLDRLLKPKKAVLRKKIYGTTRPGSLLKHHIPIKTDSWDVDRPGFTEIDLVSHSGDCAEGRFANTLDQTDIDTAWVERRCVLGKDQEVVRLAIDDIRDELPFDLLGLDSDNGSEFINQRLWEYCQTAPEIKFTRGRPYKKDDNAHIEQKNWTHVRKLLGYSRYDTQQAVDAINDLYRHELRWFQNLFQPSVKLVRKIRVGSKLKRKYDAPATPFQRVLRSGHGRPAKVAELKRLQEQLDPFLLADVIARKLDHIWALRSKAPKPSWLVSSHGPLPHYRSRPKDKDISVPSPWPVLDRYRNILNREQARGTWS